MDGFYYLGSPYTKYKAGIHAAFLAVCSEAARLVSAGVIIYSPIAHTHPIAIHGNIDPLDLNIWLPVERPLMDAACGLIVLKMDGWEESVGLKYEIDLFQQAGKPIIYMDVGQDVQEIIDAVKLAHKEKLL
jgi:hypothetical protein